MECFGFACIPFFTQVLPMMQPSSISSLFKGRKSQRSSKAAEAASQRGSSNKPVTIDTPKLKSQYGVDAWKRWIQWRQTQPNLEKPRFGCKCGFTVNTTTKAVLDISFTWLKIIYCIIYNIASVGQFCLKHPTVKDIENQICWATKGRKTQTFTVCEKFHPYRITGK